MAGVLRAVIVSDLHLGSNPILDDFTRDADFEAFLQLPEVQPMPEGRVDLVLLGDSFDLWQSVTDAECEAEKAREIDLRYGAISEVRRLAGVRVKHPECFEALGRFARQPGCTLVFVAGNHDHSLVQPAVQAALAGHLGLAPGAPSLAFRTFYEDPDLALYADHGSQYDKNNDYDSFEQFDWQQDCRGYYFVKLFFNRIERRDPRIENSPDGWAGLWHWLRRVANFPLLAQAIRYFGQYWVDPRVPRRLTVRAAGAPGEAAVIVHRAAPVLLVGGAVDRAPGSFFSHDPDMEEFFRVAYDRSADVRIAVNEILESWRAAARRGPVKRKTPGLKSADRRKALARRRPEVPRPSGMPRRAAAEARLDIGPPEDVAWAQSLFGDRPYFRDRLEADIFRFVVFGHTHRELVYPLSGGATYLNTGTWATEETRLPVVVAETLPGGRATARLVHYQNRQLS